MNLVHIPNEVVFSVLRTLKNANKGDTYYENYLWHYNKRKDTFFDIYHFSWAWAIANHPKSILEIGTRTGISLCQLLSGYMDSTVINRVVCCDVFNDGFISPELVRYNLRVLGFPDSLINQVDFKVGDSKLEIPKLKETFDYILVDGDHSPEGARADLENVRLLVNPGGVIVFDDIGEDGMSLSSVWNEFSMKYKDDFSFNQDYNGKGLGWAIKL